MAYGPQEVKASVGDGRTIHRRRLSGESLAVAQHRPDRCQAPLRFYVVGLLAEALLQQSLRGGQGGVRDGGGVLLWPWGRLHAFAQRQFGPEKSHGGPERAAGQAQGAVDDLRPALRVAALLLDDRLPDQRPVVRRGQQPPLVEQFDGPVQGAAAVVQARQPIVGRQTRRRQLQQHLHAGLRAFCPASSCSRERSRRNASPRGA